MGVGDDVPIATDAADSARVGVEGIGLIVGLQATQWGFVQWRERYARAFRGMLILVNEGSQCQTKSVGQ
jgi:hypothetical protein